MAGRLGRRRTLGSAAQVPLYTQAVTNAKATLARIPPDGLTPQVWELRKRVETAIPNIERIISEAEALRRGAQAEFEILIDTGDVDAACAVLDRLRAAPPMDRLGKAYLGLILATSWLETAHWAMMAARKKGGERT